MIDFFIIGVKCMAAIVAGVIAGNGAVWVFNKMPPEWLCDYGQKPSKELRDPYTQRVKSYPWKFVFTMFFIIIGIKLVMDDWRFSVGAAAAVWLLLEMSIADLKYRIVPDQLIILLAVTALGFIPFQSGWLDCLLGGVIGFGIMGFVSLAGKLAYRREAVGGGDIKLFAALGLVLGVRGVLAVFIMTTLISSAHFIWLIARKKIKRTDTVPMVPYIALASSIYLVFLWGYVQILWL